MSIRGISGAPTDTSDGNAFIGELLKDVALSLGIVALVALLLYAYAGIWPPMVSVDGTSMYPNMKEGDLIIVRGLDRVNIVTYDAATSTGYVKFNDYGDVIVYRPMGNHSLTPVIHRAMYWVDEGEPMWKDGPPAPHSGYITQGDNNFLYDQSSAISSGQPVKPEWIIGVSQYRIPGLGLIRTKIG